MVLSRDSRFTLSQGGVKLCVCGGEVGREGERESVFVVEEGELPVYRLFKSVL